MQSSNLDGSPFRGLLAMSPLPSSSPLSSLSALVCSSMQFFRKPLMQKRQIRLRHVLLFMWTMPTWSPGLLLRQDLLLSCISVAVDLSGQHLSSEPPCTPARGSRAQKCCLGNINSDSFAEVVNPEPVVRPASPIPRPRNEVLDDTLTMLKSHGLTWGDLVLYVSDPASKRGTERYKGMFDVPGRVEDVLAFWTSSRNSRTAREAIHSWIMAYIKKLIGREASRATKGGMLQSRKMRLDEAFVLKFSLTKVHESLRRLCPIMTELLREFASTTRQRNMPTEPSIARKDMVSYPNRMAV